MPGRDLNDKRRHVHLHPERVSDTADTEYPGVYPGEDHSWDLIKFKQHLVVQVQRLSEKSIELDLVGVDASVANALRRILLAEVPSIAIENVYVQNNTSVIHDEVLAHRLGLIPLAIDPRLFEERDPTVTDPEKKFTDRNTVVFKLDVTCKRQQKVSKNETDPTKLYHHSNVYSRDLIWEPQGEQGELFAHRPLQPSNGNILIAKLRPGQNIDLQAHACKGIGTTHAKWSPVATASYRLLPHIIIRQPIPSPLCHKFASCFAEGVIEVREKNDGSNEAVVANPRKDTVSREVLRHPEFEGMVELTRIRDFFLFNIESTGPYPPQDLFPEAIKVMRNKIATLRIAAEALIVREDLDMS